MLQDWEQELQLETPELEMALQVVQNACQNSDEEYAQVEVPTQLQHLTKEQWEEVCYLLSFLQWQMEQMPIH